MKCVISTTYSNTYLYFLPIVTWCWNKLGVDVICFIPDHSTRNNRNSLPETEIENRKKKYYFMLDTCEHLGLKVELKKFSAPEHKEATYAQCSRLYAACLDLPEDEVLITGDVDMAVFKLPPYNKNALTILGSDLAPDNQYPICYSIASKSNLEWIFETKGNTYQSMLDELLGDIECDHFKGNYWGKDQEELFLRSRKANKILVPRSNGQNQFAQNRYDRDDAYLLERLNPDTIDFHMPRPGYEEKNFDIILKVLQYHYPKEDFTWLINYNEQYKQLL